MNNKLSVKGLEKHIKRPESKPASARRSSRNSSMIKKNHKVKKVKVIKSISKNPSQSLKE